MTTLPLAAAAGEVTRARAAVPSERSTHSFGWVQALVLIFVLILMLVSAFVVGLLVGRCNTGRGEADRLRAELRASSREAALRKLAVDELKLLVVATGVQPGGARKDLMIMYLVMQEERQFTARKGSR